MIPWFYDWLKQTTGEEIHLLRYITARAGIACFLAFGLSLLLGGRVIRKLISLKVGQPVRTAEEVHKLAELHGGKAGTPTMGGVLIIGTVLFAVLLAAPLDNPFIWVVTFVFVSLGLLGFADDYLKVAKKSSAGISSRAKLAGQLTVAVIAAVFLMNIGPETGSYIRELHVPFKKEPLIADMGWWCVPFFALVIVGCSNAVNLTDGLDGLAVGCSVTVAMAYTFFCYLVGHAGLGQYLNIPHNPYVGDLSVFCMALVGAGMGFLWFNCHPAKVFMGDTGSLALGGAFAALAICSKHEAVLVLVGGVFVMEAGSVILQVASFKLRGKRIFRMSPIHHHFELKGWHENQVIIRFWSLSIFCALLGLATLKLR